MKRLITLAIAFILALMLCFAASAKDVTVLFTHDLHSHLLPSRDEDGGEYGGYARLMTVINEQKEKYPDAVLVDGGDFAMGSLFQTAYATSAIELRIMGKMGYDVTTFGNHEFDYLPSGLISMLNAAKESGDALPEIVEANYLPADDNTEMLGALNNYGVKRFTVIERGGVYFVVFGIFGYDADNCAPNSGMVLQSPVETAQRVVDDAVKFCIDTYGAEPVVICLSHSGTDDGEGEDFELAKEVNGIDVIVSGHTHTTLREPIVVNNTYIVSAGEYGRNLGVVNFTFDGGTASLKDYTLISIDENVADDAEIAALVEGYKTEVEKNYLSNYGFSFDEVLLNNPYEFETVKKVKATQHESTLGNVFSDAYKWAAEKASGKAVDVALTAAGVLRETLPLGDVTVSDVFNAASLGVGTEGELIAIYLTGKDLKTALEVDASVQPLMKSAQLYFAGVEYSFNTNRMIFNKVDYAMLRRADGTLEKIENDKLYRVVTGMYCGQMLGAVESTSFGLISITPRDENGNPIEVKDLGNYVVTDNGGVKLKEWYAISSYLKEMDGEMSENYSAPDGRKVVYSSLNPVKLLRGANIFTFVLLAVIAVLVLAVVLVVRKIIRKKK